MTSEKKIEKFINLLNKTEFLNNENEYRIQCKHVKAHCKCFFKLSDLFSSISKDRNNEILNQKLDEQIQLKDKFVKFVRMMGCYLNKYSTSGHDIERLIKIPQVKKYIQDSFVNVFDEEMQADLLKDAAQQGTDINKLLLKYLLDTREKIRLESAEKN